MTTKTGGDNTTWVELERPKPVRVADHYAYWGDPPPEMSERCRYWMRQIDRGWRPSRRVATIGYDGTAEWFGVYLWEYLHVIWPRWRKPPHRPDSPSVDSASSLPKGRIDA